MLHEGTEDLRYTNSCFMDAPPLVADSGIILKNRMILQVNRSKRGALSRGTEVHTTEGTEVHTTEGTEVHTTEGTEVHTTEGTEVHTTEGTEVQLWGSTLARQLRFPSEDSALLFAWLKRPQNKQNLLFLQLFFIKSVIIFLFFRLIQV